jgi:hypothetical protein
VKFVKGDAIDGVRIDQDLFGTSLESAPFRVIQTCTPADDEEADESDVADAESLGKSLRAFEVVKMVESVG